ncbi:twitching motility protein PilT, partial [Klebsiella pneumoniae]|nr:twitching motility protein PilT [Klebsiella pneumoniae]
NREGKQLHLPGVIQTGMLEGMLTFNQSLQQCVAAGEL